MERDIGAKVALYSNPISKRAEEHNIRMQHILSDFVNSITFSGQVVLATPNNIPQVNRAFSLVLSAVQKIRDRITADEEKHLIAKTRDLGWKLVTLPVSLHLALGGPLIREA